MCGCPFLYGLAGTSLTGERKLFHLRETPGERTILVERSQGLETANK
jgi:hypothetical protein